MTTILTAKNEEAVMKVSRNLHIKQLWQTISAVHGKGEADKRVAKLEKLPTKTVKAARYYWN